MATSTTQSLLITQTTRMLSFWRVETEKIKPETMKALEAERQNLYRAVQIGLRFPETTGDTAFVLSQATPFIAQRGYWLDWIPFLQQCLTSERCQSPTYRPQLLIGLGQLYRANHQLDEAIAAHLEAEQIAMDIGQLDMVARIRHELLDDYHFTKEFEKAKAIGESAINLLKQTNGSQTLLASCYKMMGTVLFKLGETEAAEQQFILAMSAWREVDNSVHLARTLNDFSILLLALKRYEEAENHLRKAESLLEFTINELDKCLIYINLGNVYNAQQKWEVAETVFHKANSPYLRQSVALVRKAQVNNNLGYVLFKQEKYEAAEEYLQQALQLWREMGNDLSYANTLSTYADSLLARQGVRIALPFYDELLSLLARYPQNLYAQKLQNEYIIIREQAREKVK